MTSKSLIGVISDTHGLLREEAVDLLRDSQLIIHAGDIGRPEVLETLQRLAPVVAVRGNNDKGAWADPLPEDTVAEFQGRFIYVVHDLHDLHIDPAAAGFQVVVTGHSHRAAVHHSDGVLYLNPGSAGPRRFKLPVTLAILQVEEDRLEARIETIAA